MLYKEKYRSEPARLAGWDYRTPAWYFVTICVESRASKLGFIENECVKLTSAGKIVEIHLLELPTHYSDLTVDRFMVMPNHVHVLLQIDGPTMPPAALNANVLTAPKAGSLSSIVRSYKAGVSRAWRQAGTDVTWQPRFHDHIVRSQALLTATRTYIEDNPKNWLHDPDR
jgi:REP element-mobilizing transposase RayT